MRGHIQQRGKTSWRVKAYVGRDADGVRRYVERTIRGTLREAERELSRLLVEVDEGRHAAAAPITFGELLDRWLDVKRRLVEPKTIESYEWVNRNYVRPSLGERKVASLRPVDLDGLYSDLHRRGLSARTVRICHTVIRQALEQARRWGLIARNPAVDATPPVQRRREIVPPTVECDGPLGVGSLQFFVPSRFEEHYFTFKDVAEHRRSLRQLCTFDLVSNNTDRKGGHILLSDTGHLWGIDHGLSFHEEFKLRTVMWDYAGEPIETDLIDDVARWLEADPSAALSELLSEAEISAMRDRANAVIAGGHFPHDPTGRRYPWPLV